MALGISTHAVLILLGSLVLFTLGTIRRFQFLLLFSRVDGWRVGDWVRSRPSEALLVATLYVLLSFLVSHWLGFVYGIFRLRMPITSYASQKSRILKRLGLEDKLGERPLLYETLLPEDDNLVFLEIEMRANAGFYAGQLSVFAIVRDEEPHKPVSLINAWRKDQRSEQYQPIEADSILIDLADAIEIRVIQRPPHQERAPGAALVTEEASAEPLSE